MEKGNNMNQAGKEKLASHSIAGKAATTTTVLAEKFSYNHNYLMKKISNLACSTEFKEQNFHKWFYVDRENDCLRDEYLVTLSGLTALGMGYRKHREYSKELEELVNAFAHQQTRLNMFRAIRRVKEQIDL
ncbi:hypothetical protein ACFS7Z_07045 [Pontibacter toksunensis]|uniref:Uncharacterized protein n=1 Tax=Pontibacter toksunensis TaxID=1332631 RepID=A0ABW6BQV0_9BACT